MSKLRKIIVSALLFCGIAILPISCLAAEYEEEPFELTDLWRESTPKLVLNGFYAGDDGNYYNEEETVMITLTESSRMADQFLIMGDKNYSIMGLTSGMSEDEVSAILNDELLYADVMYMGYRVQLYYIEYGNGGLDYEIVVFYFGDYATQIAFYNLNEDDLLTFGNCEEYDETSWYAQTYSVSILTESGEESDASECYIAYTSGGYFGIYIADSFTEILWTDCTEEYEDGVLTIYHSSDAYAIMNDKECSIDCYDEDGTYYRLELKSGDNADVDFDKDWYQKYTFSDGGNTMSFSWLDDGYFAIEFEWGSYSGYDLDSNSYYITEDGYYHYEGDGYAIEYDAVNNAVLFIPGAGGSSWLYADTDSETTDTETVIILGGEEESIASASSVSGDGFVENWYEVYPKFYGSINTPEDEYIWFSCIEDEDGNTLLRVFFDEGDVSFDVLADGYIFESDGYAAGGYRYDALYDMGISMLYYPDADGGSITIEVSGYDDELWYTVG
ncbi:MAG: hypothetical protein LUG99_21350 [Lachnospiraceae bacterium]|nr:hypothetical protein [Lachnospiraceae bacterium]